MHLNDYATHLSMAIANGEVPESRVPNACRLLIELDAGNGAKGQLDVGSFSHVLERLAAIESEISDMRAESQALAECFVELCESLRVRRALVSTVRSDRWVPERLFLASDLDNDHENLRAFLEGTEISLRSAALERSIVRSRSPLLVEAPQTNRSTFKPLMKISDSHGYAVAPVVARGRVVGLIHIDRHDDPAGATDLENASLVGEVLALAVDDVTHRRRLATLSAQAVAIAESAAIAPRSASREVPPSGQAPTRFHGPGLTGREQQVLDLLAQGMTNREISQRTEASEAAVKSRVSTLLSKLGVRTRTEAAALAHRDGG